MASVEVEKVSFRYLLGFSLQEVSLDIPSGSFLALIGPNGSGKTTLLRLMSKTLKPDTGRILLEGSCLESLSSLELARKMAVIASEQHFEFPFLVRDVVSMGRFPHQGRLEKTSQRDRQVVDESLQMTQTEHLADRPISALSSGERQRVLVARALAQTPSILMLDEPTAHLDINYQIGTFRLLRQLNRSRGMTIITVLHDLTAAAVFCPTVVLLHQGRLIKQGSPKEVITPEIIRETYQTEVSVHPSPVGGFPQISYAPDEG